MFNWAQLRKEVMRCLQRGFVEGTFSLEYKVLFGEFTVKPERRGLLVGVKTCLVVRTYQLTTILMYFLSGVRDYVRSVGLCLLVI